VETIVRPAPREHLTRRYLPSEKQTLSQGQYNAIYRGKVINTNDPQNRGRVLVRTFKFDSANELDENYEWAFVLDLLGGPQNSGIHIIPPIGSIGFIGYLDADGATAIWLGASNLKEFPVEEDEEVLYTIPSLPVEMDDDPTTIVWKTQYPTREDDVTNLDIGADSDEPETWIKSENLLKLSEDEFTILKYNQGRTSKNNYAIGYTYNFESYTLEDDVMLEGEIADDEDTTDPLNLNYSNFFRIQDDETRWFYRTKVTKKNESQEDAEFSAYSSIWMDDDGVHLGDIWNNSINTTSNGISIISTGSAGTGVFSLEDDWGNFIKMQQNGMWLHGANEQDNPQVSDPTGTYEYGDDFEVLRFNNETPGLLINTLGTVDVTRLNTGGGPKEYLRISEGLLQLSTANSQGSIAVEPMLITITDSLGTFRLDANDTKSDSMNFKVNASANVEIIGNAKVKIIGNAKVEIGNLVDLGAAIGDILNKTAMIISPPGTSGGPCTVPFAGQVLVKG